MRLRGEAYSQRLEGYSKSTLELIRDGLATDVETVIKMHAITTDSELDEAEVRARLIQLLNSTKTNKEDPTT